MPSHKSSKSKHKNYDVLKDEEVENAVEHDHGTVIHFPSMFIVDSGIIENEHRRKQIRKGFLFVVMLTRICYAVALVTACAASPVNGIPTISYLLATVNYLSILFIPFQCLYILIMVIMASLYTSSTHVTNKIELLEPWAARPEIQSKINATMWLNVLAFVCFILLLPFWILIHVIPVTESSGPHYVVAITGVVLALIMHTLLFIIRIIKANLFHDFIKSNQRKKNADSSKYFKEIHGTRNNKLRLFINFLFLLLGYGYATAFSVLININYMSDFYTQVAILEYLLYDIVLGLDGMRMIDVYLVAK